MQRSLAICYNFLYLVTAIGQVMKEKAFERIFSCKTKCMFYLYYQLKISIVNVI